MKKNGFSRFIALFLFFFLLFGIILPGCGSGGGGDAGGGFTGGGSFDGGGGGSIGPTPPTPTPTSSPTPAAWLEGNTRYNWQVEAIDKNGTSSAGPVWSFTTGNSSSPGSLAMNMSVSADVARKVAEVHLRRNGQDNVSVISMRVLKDESGNTDLAYVFNLKTQGYIVVPCRAIDPLPPVIAYSWTSDFSWHESPENMLLSMLRKDISLRGEAFDRHLVIRSRAIFKNMLLWSEYLNDKTSTAGRAEKIGPLFTFASWDQNSPYNKYCPRDPQSGTTCYAEDV
jgi:hypothetical protein